MTKTALDNYYSKLVESLNESEKKILKILIDMI